MGKELKSGEKIRDSRFELIRIVAMLLIIASHCTKFTFGSDYEFLKEPPSLNYAVSIFAVMFGNVGTYLFIILTCWFSVGKISFKASRVTRMLWQTWTTCIICIIASVLFLHSLSAISIIRELITPFDTQYWFVSAMVVFTFLLPVLQFLDAKLDSHKLNFICILLIILRPVRVILSNVLVGDLGDFITVFFIVSYMKRNPDNWLRKYAKLGLAAFTLIVAALLVFRFVMPDKLFGITLFGANGGLYRSIIAKLRLRTFLQLYCAVCVFYLMMEIRLKPSKTINFIAKYAFGVYLWHYNYATRSVIWNDIFHANHVYTDTKLYILVVLLAPALIYIGCSVLEFIRSKLLDDWLYDRLPWNRKLENLIDRIYNWTETK